MIQCTLEFEKHYPWYLESQEVDISKVLILNELKKDLQWCTQNHKTNGWKARLASRFWLSAQAFLHYSGQLHPVWFLWSQRTSSCLVSAASPCHMSLHLNPWLVRLPWVIQQLRFHLPVLPWWLVQWLRIILPSSLHKASVSGQEDSTCHRATKSQGATTVKPSDWSLCSETREARQWKPRTETRVALARCSQRERRPHKHSQNK